MGCNSVDFITFQDEFDLDKDSQLGDRPRNSFESVARAVQAKYPEVRFTRRAFVKGEGQKKLEAVQIMISRQQPVLISLALAPFKGKGWHIMPVVDSSADELTLLWGVDEAGTPQTRLLAKKDLVSIHENFDGGDDIAYLDKRGET
jgi:hypothetical protein